MNEMDDCSSLGINPVCMECNKPIQTGETVIQVFKGTAHQDPDIVFPKDGIELVISNPSFYQAHASCLGEVPENIKKYGLRWVN